MSRRQLALGYGLLAFAVVGAAVAAVGTALAFGWVLLRLVGAT